MAFSHPVFNLPPAPPPHSRVPASTMLSPVQGPPPAHSLPHEAYSVKPQAPTPRRGPISSLGPALRFCGSGPSTSLSQGSLPQTKLAWPVWLSWLECCPVSGGLRGRSLAPGGTVPGLGAYGRQCLSRTDASLSLPLPTSSLSKKQWENVLG